MYIHTENGNQGTEVGGALSFIMYVWYISTAHNKGINIRVLKNFKNARRGI